MEIIQGIPNELVIPLIIVINFLGMVFIVYVSKRL